MAINDVGMAGGCIMYEKFFVHFWVIILCSLRRLKPKILGFSALCRLPIC